MGRGDVSSAGRACVRGCDRVSGFVPSARLSMPSMTCCGMAWYGPRRLPMKNRSQVVTCTIHVGSSSIAAAPRTQLAALTRCAARHPLRLCNCQDRFTAEVRLRSRESRRCRSSHRSLQRCEFGWLQRSKQRSTHSKQPNCRCCTTDDTPHAHCLSASLPALVASVPGTSDHSHRTGLSCGRATTMPR